MSLCTACKRERQAHTNCVNCADARFCHECGRLVKFFTHYAVGKERLLELLEETLKEEGA